MSVSRLAVAVFSALALLTMADGATANVIADKPACLQAVADTAATRDKNPKVDEASKTMFDQLTKQAADLCEQAKYDEANAHIGIALSLLSGGGD